MVVFVLFLSFSYMCCCPVTIRNPKYKSSTFLKSVDKEFISVPCGHCFECETKKINDYVVRSYYEYLDCVAHGGFMLFDTLTFNNYSCPEYNGFRYFSRDVFQKFFKRLYRNLEYSGYDVRFGKLKYLLSTEYGSLTFRVHGHVIFACQVPNLTPSLLNEFIVKSWRNVDSKTVLGFNDNRKVDERVINSIYGIKYVCKYVCKDTSIKDALSYHHDSEISRFIFNYCLNNNISFSELDYSHLRQVFLSYKFNYDVPKDFDIFPFVSLSHGFGMSFFDNITLDDIFNDIVIYDNSDSHYSVYSVPQYYLRKVFYTYHSDSKRYIPNDLCSLLKQNTSNKQVQQFIDNQLRIENIYNSLPQKSRDIICNKFKIDDSCLAYKDYINALLAGRSFEHFVKYVVYLRNVHVSPYLEFLYYDNLDSLDNSFIECFVSYRDNCLLHDMLPFRTDLFHSHPEVNITDDFSSNLLFNHLKPFENYDLIFDFIKTVTFYYKRACQTLYLQRKNDIEKYHTTLKKCINSNFLFD